MATNPFTQYGQAPSYGVDPYYNTYSWSTRPVQQPMPSPRQSDMTWVQGETGMKAYMVAPNTRAILWDQDNPVIYIKTADASGVASVKILDYKERGAEENATPVTVESAPDFVTRSDFEAMKDSFQRQINRLGSQINNMRSKGGQNG